MPIKPAKAKKEEKGKETSVQTEANVSTGTEKYYEAIGRRKSAQARVRIYTKKSSDQATEANESGPEEKAMITINNQDYADYFHRDRELQNIAESPLKKLKSINRFKATIKVSGGGIHGQAEAIRHGLARALTMFDQNFAKKLKKSGYLTRDSREKERRKYGLKKARKAPQWAKR
ncbi:MAG: 30S ribosomal protein S9 [bacterium]|nr:30S ribosomal protein S9 [bacterium]